MPALQFQNVPVKDFGNGIDAISAENSSPEGYVDDLTNVDPTPEGYLSKRKGYQGIGGNLPVRIRTVSTATNQICFNLDTSIDLSTIRSTPIVVQGRLSSGTIGPFSTTNSAYYWVGFSANPRKSVSTGTSTLAVAAAEHGLSTADFWTGWTKSTSLIDNSNDALVPDSMSINTSTYQMTLGYTNGTGSTFDSFVYTTSMTSSAGTTYVANQVVATGNNTYTITAATHSLNNSNILVKVYDTTTTAGSYVEVIPDEVVINSSGDVTISFTGVTTGFTARIYLHSVTNLSTGSVASSTSQSVTLSSLTTPFLFVACYLEDGTDKRLVIPDSITVDAATNEALVSFTNGTTSSTSFQIVWDYGTVLTNQLCVDYTGATGSDTSPQLTLWGLDHDTIYNTSAASAAGWVTHLDTYRSEGENRLVSGLGGNLFALYGRTESGISSAYKLPLRYPNLRQRVSSQTVIGPAFTSLASTRTRGYIQTSSASLGFVRIISITYDSGNGYVKYILETPSHTISGTPLSTTTDLEDYLEVEQTGFARNSGLFKIKQVSLNLTADTSAIWVENDQITSSDWDESNYCGRAGCFTDQLTFTALCNFLPGDILLSDSFDDEDLFEVQTVSSSSAVFKGVNDVLTISGGLRVVAKRAASVWPLREIDSNGSDIDSIDSIVAGDMIRLTGEGRLFRVLSANTNDNSTGLSISGDGEEATLTGLSAARVAKFRVGQKVLLVRSGVYSGEVEITSLVEITTSNFGFTFDSTETDTISGTATIKGFTIEVDEVYPSFQDNANSSITIDVKERWLPIEAPADSFTANDITPATYYRHLNYNDYDAQPMLRSVMVGDSLYLTNYYDPVHKFDGSNLYIAGLPRWQPYLFAQVDTGAAAKISLPLVTTTAVTNPVLSNELLVTTDSEVTRFAAGDLITHSVDGRIYQVERIDPSTTDAKIFLTTPISTMTGGDIKKVFEFRYYFRLNMVDANGQRIATAPVGQDDFRVRLSADAAVNIKMIGLPSYSNYDYDRIELQIYRTKAGTVAPYYLVSTIPLSFSDTKGYFEFTDAVSDATLADKDIVSISLVGQELGTAWAPPPKAKYVTSAGNRLVLANITDEQTWDIALVNESNSSFLMSSFTNQKFLFRKDSTSTSTFTDMVSTVTYECTQTSTAVTAISYGASDFTVTIGSTTGFAIDNWVYLFSNSSSATPGTGAMGWWQIKEITNATQFKVKATGLSAPATEINRMAYAVSDKYNVPVYTGTDDYNSDVVNTNTDTQFTLVKRLANAINASMRLVNISSVSMSTFRPWLLAEAGSTISTTSVLGRLIVRLVVPLTTTAEFKVPSSLPTGTRIFVNELLKAVDDEVAGRERVLPSRIVVSYNNYPEIIDAPFASLDSESDSAVDVNSADGQEITGVIPFFGESAFGASLQSGVVVVFKSHSIYLVDLAQKSAGNNAVQKIESQGLGCTMPYSIAPTKDGIIFANESGIYRLTRNLTIDYVGRFMERNWEELVEKGDLLLPTGHHAGISRQYKLSLPAVDEGENSLVFVYNHSREYSVKAGGSMGSWTKYDSFPATAWANLGKEEYFSSFSGRVFSLRNQGEASDFRDDSSAIEASATLRAMDFGDGSQRKVLQYVIVHFRSSSRTEGTSLSAAVDLKEQFEGLDAVKYGPQSSNALSDFAPQSVTPVRFSLDRRKCTYIQIRAENSTIDEGMDIAEVDYRVAGIGPKGIAEAKDSV